MNREKGKKERRQWPRLPLPIPVFVRSRDKKGKDFLEFASALNVSAGGMVVAVRRPVPVSAEVALEIPSAPLGSGEITPQAERLIRAKAVRVVHAEGHHLVGLKFRRPLVSVTPAGSGTKGKSRSQV